MGVIYAAHDPVIDRKVAIKLIRADLLSGEEHADYVARFQREARAAGRCTHPNIVAIYDFAVHEGNPFLAMEYVEASDLRQVLAQSKRLPTPEAIAVIGQVLDALGCAHELGIVHRDVKPANILLLANGRVKMTDFGISRLESSELTRDGSVVGTPSYMSPEQCRGDAVDARSDLFSTGVVLYEMLSGERPFPGRNFTEILLRLVSEPAVDIRSKLAGLPPALASALDRALAKAPADRFTSAAEMATTLRQAVNAPMPVDADRTVVMRREPDAGPSFAEATLTTIERKLARHVGPIAHHLVQNAARQAGTFDELCDSLAQRIEQPEQRAQFRQEVQVDQSAASLPRRADIAADEVQRAERELVRYVGPIARILAKRALASADSVDQLWQLLAAHIERDADRRAFLERRAG